MSVFRTLLSLLACTLVLSVPARAAQVEAGAVYRFCSEDFSEQAPQLQGICITGIPKSGPVKLGSRVIRCGDLLPADRLSQLVFSAGSSAETATETFSYLPVFADGPAGESRVEITVLGRRNEAPAAQDSAAETYRNLPVEGLLKVTDPGESSLVYTLIRPPRRGEVVLRRDGSYLYTPGKNKVGNDYFTFSATDSGGLVSRAATVIIRILKTDTELPYCDTVGRDCRFTAEWLRSAGIFTGETVAGQTCFSPDKPVTRGQFLAMLMQTLKLPVERQAEPAELADGAPLWLRPYLTAALRSGLIVPSPESEGALFRSDQPIRDREACGMIRQAVRIALPAGLTDAQQVAVWAADTVRDRPGDVVLTRSDAAQILWQLNRLNDREALYRAVFRRK